MMAKHTPAPWKVNSQKHGIFIMAGNYCLASTADVRTNSDCRMNEEAKANAHLIAAAPELLEALKGLFKNNQDIDAYLQAKDKAVQAIAKAEGGA
jgi:predicted ATPase